MPVAVRAAGNLPEDACHYLANANPADLAAPPGDANGASWVWHMFRLRYKYDISGNGGGMRGAVLLLVAWCAAGMGYAEAQNVETRSLGMALDIPGDMLSNRIVLVCSDTVLIHGLVVSVHNEDPAMEYRIPFRSVMLGDEILLNPPHIFVPGVSLDVLRWGGDRVPGSALSSHPLVLSESAPLSFSLRSTDVGPDGVAWVDASYLANPGASCSLKTGLAGPQAIGLVVPGAGPLAGIAADLEAAMMLALGDFNGHLRAAGEYWSLRAVTIHDDGLDPALSLRAVRELSESGISVMLGPVTDVALAGVREHVRDNRMVAVSCCSAAGSLSAPDGIFRLAPGAEGRAEALAALIRDDQIGHVLLVYDDGTAVLKDLLAARLAPDVGVSTIRYGPDESDLPSMLRHMISEYDRLAREGRADDSGVVLAVSRDVARIVGEASVYDVLGDMDWYGLGPAVGLDDLTRGGLGEFATNTRFTGVRAVPEGPAADSIYERLRHMVSSDGLHLYSAYDSVWVLGRAMQMSQDADPDILREMIPVVSRLNVGAMGMLDVDADGDLAYSHYGVWRVVAGDWTRVGTYNPLSGQVWYDWWWE